LAISGSYLGFWKKFIEVYLEEEFGAWRVQLVWRSATSKLAAELLAACSWRPMRICGIRRADEDLIGFGAVPSTKKRGSWHRQSVEKRGDVYKAARPLLKIQPREDIRLMA
jgi:hypothetical protein